MISRQHKLAFLFFSKDNPLWKEIKGNSFKLSDITVITKVQQSTLSNWRHGLPIDTDTIDKAFNNVIYKLTENKNYDRAALVKRFQDEYFLSAKNSNLKTRIYDIAKETLGMPMEQTQKIVDEVIYDKFGMFPTMHYHSAEDAEEQFQRFSGNYNLLVRREIEGKIRWLKAPLRVRYVLRLKGGAVIRCKVNAPKIKNRGEERGSYWEYDGFLRTRSNKIFWTMERREAMSSDYFYFVTDQGRVVENKLSLQGKYLSIGQDEEHSIVADQIMMQRVTDDEIESVLKKKQFNKELIEKWDVERKIREWMGCAAGEISPKCAGYEKAEQLWDRLKELSATT